MVGRKEGVIQPSCRVSGMSTWCVAILKEPVLPAFGCPDTIHRLSDVRGVLSILWEGVQTQ